MLRRDDARGERLPKNRIGGLQIRLPEEAVLTHQRVFSRHAVDDDVDALVGAQDAPKQRFHVVLARVIDAQCDRGAEATRAPGRERPDARHGPRIRARPRRLPALLR